MSLVKNQLQMRIVDAFSHFPIIFFLTNERIILAIILDCGMAHFLENYKY